MDEPDLHPALEPVSFLLGTWRGSGTGSYPNIDDFTYEEETRFWHTGRPFLCYLQRTWAQDSGNPMHSEMGFWRPQRDGTIELALTHSFGVVEISLGEIGEAALSTESTTLTSSPTAKEIAGLARRFEVVDDVLSYELKMAFGESELQPHLRAELKKVT